MAKIIPFPLQKRIFQPYGGFYGYNSYLPPYYAKNKLAGKTLPKKSKPGKLINLGEAKVAFEAKAKCLTELAGESAEQHEDLAGTPRE